MTRLAEIAPESVLLAGAGRAILLQIALPEVGYGVARHSDFAAQPMKRLNATLSYIYALTGGTEEQARIMRAAVNRAHRPVRNPPAADASSVRQPGDPHYDARDPALQLWVAATLYDTAVTVYELVHGALAPDDAERVYREYAVLGTALQMPEELWPADRAAFLVYWNGMLERLRVDATVQDVADTLLRAENAPLAIRAGMPLARFVTVALLPPSLRARYGFSWTPARDRRFRRLVRLTAPVYRMLPARLRHAPQRHYLARIRSHAHASPPAPARDPA